MTRGAIATDRLAPPWARSRSACAAPGCLYLTEISDCAAMSQAYTEHFAEPYPARTAIGVGALPLARRLKWTWWRLSG